MPAAKKSETASTARKALLATVMATGGAVLLAGGAQAQAAATPPDGFSPISSVDGVSRVEMGADGSVQLVMADGRTVLIPAQDVSVIDGVVYLSDAAIEANVLTGAAAASAAGSGGGAILGVLGGAGLLGAAAGGGGGGGGGSTPTTPTPPTNTNPPVFSSSTTASVDENVSGTVYTATATDADGNTVTYSISGGADASLFSINSSTGAVTFNAPPDFENPGDSGADNDYVITVRASDGTNTTDQTVTISVGDLDEAPAFTSAASVGVAENTAGVVYTAEAADPEGEAVTYALSGTDAALFTIDAATGAVSFVAAPDFESPADADGDNNYEITVTASDGSLTTDQSVTITVTGVDEGPAVFSSGSTASVNENASGVVYTAAATEPDGNTITYSLGGGRDNALFTIDSATGAVSFVTPPDFEAPADGDGNNIYSIVVRANDGDTVTTQAVRITVNDVDEGPAITSGASASVAENSAGVVYTAAATDPEGAAVTYALTGDDAALFSINAVTGEVSFVTPPDFEAPTDADGDNVYDVNVVASDGGVESSQAVAITVTDVDEGAPVFQSASSVTLGEGDWVNFYTAVATDPDAGTVNYTIVAGGDADQFAINFNNGDLSFRERSDFENPRDVDGDNVYEITIRASDGTSETDFVFTVTVEDRNDRPVMTSDQSVSLQENTAGVFYTATATDQDGDSVTYALSGEDAALFSIDATTGELQFLAPPDAENPLSVNGLNFYRLIVEVSDGALVSRNSLFVEVTGENEFAPTFTSGTTAEIQEGRDEVVYTAEATDADFGDTLTYSLAAGGADRSLFTIDSDTGELRFRSPPDFEAPGDADLDNVYDVTIRVTDGLFVRTQLVQVTVTDLNETGAPLINSQTAQTVSENQTSAYVIRATDAEGDSIIYSISGTDAALFSVDSETGEVSFRTRPDFETPGDADNDNVYDITVTASDGAESNSLDIEITVSDINNEVADLPDNNSTEVSMVSGGTYVGDLGTAGDEDWIRVELVAGQRYEFNLSGTGAEPVEDTYIRLLDATGDVIVENDDISLGAIRDSRISFTAETSGTYYIEVDSWDGGNTDERTGEYTFEYHHVDPLSAWNYQQIGDYLNANGFGGLQWDRSAGDTITVNISALTLAGQTLARAALQLWEDITGIQFNEVAVGGEITFDDDQDGAFAGPDSTSGGFITAASVNVSTDWLATYGNNLDGYSFQTYIHEIGHALGLGHGGPYDGSADYAVDAIYLNDSWQTTVMSYFSQNENTYTSADFGYVIGPQVADIIAVLDMYGGSTNTRSGNTTYGYNSTAGNTIFDATAFTNPVSFTIFDTGGIDTLDYSGSNANQTFDLREQAYSSLNGRDGNIGIARGTVIENAIGGGGNDTFIGNDANNSITGGGGADRFYASGGSDVFDGGSGSDTAYFSGSSTDYTVSTNGSGNTVVTDNRAGSPDGVVELISVENIVYDGAGTFPEYFGDPNDAGTEGLDPNDMPALAPLELPFDLGDAERPVMAVLGDTIAWDPHHHIYPHLSEADLALLETLSADQGNMRGYVGSLPDLDGSGLRGLVRDYRLNEDGESGDFAQIEKGHPVFEPLTLPAAENLPLAAADSLFVSRFEFEGPGDGFLDVFDGRDAQMLVLSDESSDGWA